MPLYQTPPSPVARAQGDSPRPDFGGVQVESQSMTSYQFAQIGIQTETETAIPINRGELGTINGGFESRFQMISDPTGSYQIMVTQQDIGGGEGALFTTDINGAGEPVHIDTYNPDEQETLSELLDSPPPPESAPSSSDYLSYETQAPVTPAEIAPTEEVAPADDSGIVYAPAFEYPQMEQTYVDYNPFF